MGTIAQDILDYMAEGFDAASAFDLVEDELNEKKLKAFNDKDQQTYVKVFREGQVEFQKCVVSITKKACEWIELE